MTIYFGGSIEAPRDPAQPRPLADIGSPTGGSVGPKKAPKGPERCTLKMPEKSQIEC